MKQSKTLTAFYNDLNEWINSDFPLCDYPFIDSVGLCTNLSVWCKDKYLSDSLKQSLVVELHEQFNDAGLDILTPFNANFGSYSQETKTDNIFKNPKRIAWIKNHAIYAHPVKINERVYEVHGGLYGKLYSTSGEVRTWKTYSGAYKAAQKYNSAHENYFTA